MNKTQKNILLISLFFCSINVDAQKKISSNKIDQISFIKHIGIGSKGIDRGVTVEEIAGGGYILTGYTNGNKAGGEDVFLIKTNSAGDTIWSKTFGGIGKDNGWAVRQTNDRGYIIVGFTDSFGAGGMDVYLIKTDSIGEAIWTKTYGGPGDEFGWDIRTCSDNGFIIAAQTSSFGRGEIDAYLIKIDIDGNKKWSKTYGGVQTDRIFSVQQTQDGGYVATGITYSYTNIGPGDRDGYLLKTNASGELEWFKTFGEDAYDVGHSVSLTKDGGYLVTGYGESYAVFGKRDVYLIKIDFNGKIEWTKVYGGNESERGIKGEQTKDGGYIAIGFTDKDWDVYLIKTNNKGDTLWTRTFGTKDKIDFGYTVKETNDGGYILIGHKESFDGEDGDILLIKTDREGLVDQKE